MVVALTRAGGSPPDGPSAATVGRGAAWTLEAVLSASPLAVVGSDAQGIVTFWNDAAEKVLGWSADEVIGRFGPQVPADKRGEYLDRIRQVMGGEALAQNVVTRARKDGSPIDMRVAHAPMRDADGAAIGVISFIEDITEQVRLEQARVEAEQLFQISFDSAPIGIALQGLDGRWLDANAAFCAILGRTHDEVVGAHYADVTYVEDRELSVASTEQLLAGEIESFALEKRYVRPDGEPVWVSLHGKLVRGDHNNPRLFITQAVDIDERKRLERQILESTNQLQAVSEIARRLLVADDARPLVCAAVVEIAGASAALMIESVGGSLVVTAATLPSLQGRQATTGDASANVVEFGHERIFSPDLVGCPPPFLPLLEAAGAGSVLFEPLVSEESAIGVLIVVWADARIGIDPQTLKVITLLATEAAIGIERAEFVRRLDEQAHTDQLTGLPNRRALQRDLERELARAKRGGRLVVAIIDLDHFKQFNDRHGHPEGDRLLTAAAGAWSGHLRASDTLARIGGEEFLILLPDCDEASAQDVLDRIRLATPEAQTCSIGYARWDGDEPSATLLDRADTALYVAKRSGRNRIVSG